MTIGPVALGSVVGADDEVAIPDVGLPADVPGVDGNAELCPEDDEHPVPIAVRSSPRQIRASQGKDRRDDTAILYGKHRNVSVTQGPCLTTRSYMCAKSDIVARVCLRETCTDMGVAAKWVGH